MSKAVQIDNIKIPYPSEGVIRSAQLDDTIAPEDSVELAVNMNFDRVGAIQTRPGVTEYAPQIEGSISNFGTLRNSIRPDGYDSLVELGEKDIFTESIMRYSSIAKVDDEHVIIFWSGVDNDGFVQVMETSLVTGGLVPIGTPLEFDTTNGTNNTCIRISDTHFLNVWTGANSDAFAQVFAVNSTTFAVTAVGSPLEFNTSNGIDFTIAQVDANHFIVFYNNSDTERGTATILEVNLSTFAVTQPGSPLVFNAENAVSNSCVAIGNGTHFVNAWQGIFTSNDAFIQSFSVNTSTWAITAIGSPLTFDAAGASSIEISTLGDGEHFLLAWQSNTTSTGVSHVLNVDPSTYAITTAGSQFTFQANTVTDIVNIPFGDGEHFYFQWATGGNVYAQILNVNDTGYVITALNSPLLLGPETSSDFASGVLMSPFRVIGLWRNDLTEGVGVMLKAEGDILNSRYLYAGVNDEVYNLVSGAWVSRRSGLSVLSKPRFAQYLNYIWMVNGNAAEGGDPVATSNGGAFGTDLVPENFPAGDFISAGFEGRVWVADKYVGAIYYTDIVQFTPPDVYTLTYDNDVNFITTIAPQSGEQITALYEVPRALLVFTENTITRIYGATSLDAYPAYQVGTYSQESIVETKTGIFFHHSSGFYQFDYGSQPVEISRRIIDFVKAIPRSYYENVTGVYDGFDAVEWSVGPLVVDGVAFANCVLRYTISTQVWTIYDYVGNTIKAMILYDDGAAINHIMGTAVGKVGAMDVGNTDFGQSFSYEMIDRWRSFTEMYYVIKEISGMSVYSENAAGANLMCQVQKSGPNAWTQLGTVTEANTSLMPNSQSGDFDVIRLRLAGTTQGTPVIVHGIEILSLNIKGQEIN